MIDLSWTLSLRAKRDCKQEQKQCKIACLWVVLCPSQLPKVPELSGEPRLVNVWRVRDFGILSPKWDVFIQPLPPQGSGSYLERGEKIVRTRGDSNHWLTPRKQYLPDTRGRIHVKTHKVYNSLLKSRVSPSQTESQHWVEKVDPGSHPTPPLKLSAVDSNAESSFLQWSL